MNKTAHLDHRTCIFNHKNLIMGEHTNIDSEDDLDYYVFHQANKFMLSTIRKVCALPKDKFYIDLTNVGNTVSSTILIGLKECMNNGTIKPSMNVMACGFGVGLSWGGMILNF